MAKIVNLSFASFWPNETIPTIDYSLFYIRF